MARIELIDQSLRDGQQSLWGMRMRAGHILPVAEAIDTAGYRVVDLTGILGYYTFLAMQLNAAQYPAPKDARKLPRLPP